MGAREARRIGQLDVWRSYRQPAICCTRDLAGARNLTTDDCRAAYEELKGRGVEFTDEPQEMPYGVDAGFRDPSGNAIRLTELREGWAD